MSDARSGVDQVHAVLTDSYQRLPAQQSAAVSGGAQHAASELYRMLHQNIGFDLQNTPTPALNKPPGARASGKEEEEDDDDLLRAPPARQVKMEGADPRAAQAAAAEAAEDEQAFQEFERLLYLHPLAVFLNVLCAQLAMSLRDVVVVFKRRAAGGALDVQLKPQIQGSLLTAWTDFNIMCADNARELASIRSAGERQFSVDSLQYSVTVAPFFARLVAANYSLSVLRTGRQYAQTSVINELQRTRRNVIFALRRPMEAQFPQPVDGGEQTRAVLFVKFQD
jgi:hypothetical protein